MSPNSQWRRLDLSCDSIIRLTFIDFARILSFTKAIPTLEQYINFDPRIKPLTSKDTSLGQLLNSRACKSGQVRLMLYAQFDIFGKELLLAAFRHLDLKKSNAQEHILTWIFIDYIHIYIINLPFKLLVTHFAQSVHHNMNLPDSHVHVGFLLSLFTQTSKLLTARTIHCTFNLGSCTALTLYFCWPGT